MRIFLDSSNREKVQKWLPVIAGITTNPSILKREGGDIKELADLIFPFPISVEAGGDFVTDARKYAKIPNVVVKVPLLATSGGDNIKIIRQLIDEGIAINCTALMSLSQVIIATQLGVRFVSIFAGRIDDEGGDYFRIIRDCVEFLDDDPGGGTELIVGSMRTVGNVLDAIRAKAHIVTVTPPILEKMIMHRYSLETVRKFEEDYRNLSK